MSRTQIVYMNVSAALVAITGAVYAVMKYFMTPDDEFAVANHPLQPHMLSAHVVTAPLLVFALGWLFANHIWPKFVFKEPRNRLSGIGAMALIAPMTLSGYLLEIATNETLRQAMAIAHWLTSALFVVAYVVHLIRPRVAAGAQSAPVSGGASVPFQASPPRRK
jgi:hypothetical protein